MQEKNVVTIDYLGDPERFADFLNALWFSGNRILTSDNIRECKADSSRIWKDADTLHTSEIFRDLTREVSLGTHTLLVALEAQSDIHYAMPVRVINGDSMQYHEQWRRIRNRHRQRRDLRGAGYLSGFHKKDRLFPVITLVLYFGRKPWDGPDNLWDMMNIEEFPETVRQYIADYPLRLIDVRRYPHSERFYTDLRVVFGFLAVDSEKDALLDFIEKHEKEFHSLREDAYDMIAVMSHSRELMKRKHDYLNRKGEVNMCQAINDLMRDEFQNGKTAGLREGRSEGLREGELNGIQLAKKVFFLWFSGVAPADIAKKCQITQDMVSQILDEVSQMR